MILISSLTFLRWVLEYSFREFDTRQRFSPQTIIPTTFQSFGGKNEKVLPEDALAKALRGWSVPVEPSAVFLSRIKESRGPLIPSPLAVEDGGERSPVFLKG